MFKNTDLDEFVNKMFESATNNKESDVKGGLTTFKKYLEETSMCSPEYLTKLQKIIDCSEELLALKSKASLVDVTTLFKIEPEVVYRKEEQPKQKKKEKKIEKQPSYTPSGNHRQHYVHESSNACGGSTPSYSSGCGGSSTPTYSSACGGSPTIVYRGC